MQQQEEPKQVTQVKIQSTCYQIMNMLLDMKAQQEQYHEESNRNFKNMESTFEKLAGEQTEQTKKCLDKTEVIIEVLKRRY